MVLVTRLGVTYSVDRRLYNSIKEFSVDKLKQRDDFKIFLVCGVGGSGKSAFANQMCALLDKDFGLENIGFTTKQFKQILMTMINKACTFDEAYRGISKRNTLGKDQKELLQMFFEVRQLNQVIFLCTPSFFSLDEAIATELSHGMFYIYKRRVRRGRNGKGKRVFYKFFNKRKKQKLYELAKRYGRKYSLVHTNFKGPVPTNTYVVPDEKYRKYKFDSLYGVEAGGNEGKSIPKATYEDKILQDLGKKYLLKVYNAEKSYGKTKIALEKEGIVLHKAKIHQLITQ